MSDPKYIIYGLTDPRTSQVRYVGQSSKGLRRPLEHGNGGRSSGRCKTWLKSLQLKGLKNGVVVLEICGSAEDLDPAERKWIAHGRSKGWGLTNMTDGGEGTLGHIKSPKTRAALSKAATLRQSDPEVKERARVKALGHTTSEETRSKIRMRLAGRKLPAAHVENIRSSLKGRVFNEEHRRKLSDAARKRGDQKGRTLTPEHRQRLREAALKRYAIMPDN